MFSKSELFTHPKVFRAWKFFLIPVFVFIVIHFMKDITQDLLGLPTVLDYFGDANEDLSNFHPYTTWVYHWFMVNTILLEIFLIIAIPKIWLRSIFSRIDIYAFLSIMYLTVAFFLAILLDPKLRTLLRFLLVINKNI